MKKLLCVMMACLLMLAVLAACDNTGATEPQVSDPTTTAPTNPKPTNPKPSGSKPADSKPAESKPTESKPTESKPDHTCKGTGEWFMDKDNHWRLCDTCGAQVNFKAHTIVNGSCTKCSVAVTNHFDGSVTLTTYDMWMNPSMQMAYTADGTLEYTHTFEYTYDDNGIALSSKVYADNVLFTESTFDQFGNALTIVEYNTDGSVLTNTVKELTYGENNFVTAEKTLVNDVLTYECAYALSANGVRYITGDTVYQEDGSKKQSLYNEYGDVTQTVSYDAEGLAGSVYTYAYTYDTSDNMLSKITSVDGVMTNKREYAITSVGIGTYLQKETIYEANSTYYVMTYDEQGHKLSNEGFDADGNPVNHSDKFDISICAPLQGTWQGTVEMTGDDLGFEGSDIIITAQYSLTFDAEGNMITKIDFDEDQFMAFVVASNIEYVYNSLRNEMPGFTKAEIDVLFMNVYGMTVPEYVEAELSPDDFEQDIHQEIYGVYYVEGNILYQGENWTAYMSQTEYQLDGNTLILTDSGLAKQIVLTKAEA